MGFGGKDKAQHAQARCRGVGRDMGQVGSKFGARCKAAACEPNRKNECGGRQTREGERLTRRRKNDQKKKRSTGQKKKEIKINLVVAGLDLTAFLKDPKG
jgi:hypothetical protein